ncbi:uncharacterized protein [Antedon mediterranea]|uniref:uncharacterized protein n=1 Tax=Antedon mediterranea TaxID=105859 RepID=UPI003AF6B55F
MFFSKDPGPLILITECKGFPDLPMGCGRYNFQDMDKEWLGQIAVDLENARAIERQTVLQSNSNEWREQRKLRLTSSKFGKINSRVKGANVSFYKAIFNSKNIGHIRSVSHGSANEKPALKIYATESAKRVNNFMVYDSGLVINPDLPHLGATPDGKVYDPSSNPCYGLVEIKCPLTKKSQTIEDAISDGDFYINRVDGKLELKQKHKMGYYEQIQGQMAITGLTWCDFVVYLSDSRQMAVLRVKFNEQYWNSLLLKLNKFYKHSIPYLKRM